MYECVHIQTCTLTRTFTCIHTHTQYRHRQIDTHIDRQTDTKYTGTYRQTDSPMYSLYHSPRVVVSSIGTLWDDIFGRRTLSRVDNGEEEWPRHTHRQTDRHVQHITYQASL